MSCLPRAAAAADKSIKDFPPNSSERDAILPSSGRHGINNHSKSYHSTHISGDHAKDDDGFSDTCSHSGGQQVTSLVLVSYDVMRARIVSSLVLIFYAMGATSAVVVAQYLHHRWMTDAKLNASHSSNASVCDVRNQSDPIIKKEDDVESRVSIKTMYFSYTTSVAANIICLIFGTYSDVLGRRLILLMPLLGTLINLVITFFVMRFDMTVDLLFVANLAEGLGGSYFIFLIATFSITADLDIGKSSRTIWIVVLEGTANVIQSASSIITGILIKHFSYSSSILFLISPVVIGFVIGFFFMPETRAKEEDKSKRTNPWIQVKRMFRMYYSDGNSRDRKALLLALLLFFLVVFTCLGDSITTIYQLHEPFCWGSDTIGYYGGVTNVARVVLGTIYLKGLQSLKFIRNDVIAMIGTVLIIGGSIMTAFINTTWEFFLVPVISAPFYISAGVLRAVMSYLVASKNQGAMFASVAVSETICTIVSSTVLNQVYSATVSTLPGLVFLVCGGVAVVTFFVYFIFFRYYDDPMKKQTLEIQAPSP